MSVSAIYFDKYLKAYYEFEHVFEFVFSDRLLCRTNSWLLPSLNFFDAINNNEYQRINF